MIYLASPYAHPDPAVMQQRYEAVSECAAVLMQDGKCIYSPITHNHPIAIKYSLPRDWNFWRKIDYGMLRHASAVYVLKLEGWELSVGVLAEVNEAHLLNIPVIYLNPEVYKWLK